MSNVVTPSEGDVRVLFTPDPVGVHAPISSVVATLTDAFGSNPAEIESA